METDDLADEIAARYRESRESGAPFDVRAACEGDDALFRAVARRVALQRLLDGAFADGRRDARSRQAPRVEPGQRVGTYRVLSKIGQGGMGTVFLALAEEAEEGVPVGSRVALKVLHPHLLAKGTFQDRFRREVEAGLRLHHPNIVPTLGAGRIAGPAGETVYLAMRYEEGRTLRELLARMETVPDPLLLEIASQVASGLEAVHAAGVVHRDLKPENILLADDGRVLIMDLGVARLVDDSLTLTRDGQFAGSILYAAPEQFQDQPAGPAADLYALGLTLYELASGRHPFEGRTMAAVMQAHLGEEPLPLESLAPHVSPFVVAVIATLLAKAPSARFPSAAALREVLVEGTTSAWWAAYERETTPRVEARRPTIRVRRETPVRGREEAFHELWEAWQDARDGRGRVVFLLGEDGIGKTRMLDAVVQAAALGEARILYGSYAPGSEHGGIANALREHLGRRDLERELAVLLSETPRLTSAVAAWIRTDAPPPDTPPLTADALHAALVRILRRLAADRPVLWALDEVHHAASEARARLAYLARAAEGLPVLLLLAMRDGRARADLADLARLPRIETIGLERLDEGAVTDIVRDALGEGALAERVGRLVADRTGGVPYFVVELLRGLLESGLVRQDEEGVYEERVPIETLAVPDALRALLLGRLNALAEPERTLLDLAAVQGYRFDPRLVAAACEQAPVAALRAFAAVERRDGIVRSDEKGHRFDHPLLREVVYEELAGELRTAYHTRLAEARGASAGEQPGGRTAYFLARHHLAGNRPLAARAAVVPALEFLQGQCRFVDATRLAQQALAAPGLLVGPDRVAVLLQHAEALANSPRSPGRSAALAEAWRLAQESGDPVLLTRTGAALARSLTSVEGVAQARAVLHPLHAAAVAEGDPRREAESGQALGHCAWTAGDLDEARELFARSRDLGRQLGDTTLERRALIALAMVQVRLHQLAEATRGLERALRLAREEGDRLDESTVRLHLGVVGHHLGRPDEAREQLEHVLRIAREIGHRKREGEALGSLGNVALRQGDPEAARRFHAQDLTISREIGDGEGETGATVNLANVVALQGRRDEARRLYGHALDLARQHQAPRAEAVCTSNLAMLAYDAGEYATACDHYHAGIALARRIQDVRLEGQHMVNLGYLLAEMGAWDEGAALLARRRARIGDGAEDEGRPYLGLAEAQLHEWRGEDAEADAALLDAIQQLRERGDHVGLATSLEWRARRMLARGETLAGAPLLEEAWALARALDAPDVCLLVAVDRVALAPEHEPAARRMLLEYETRARMATRIRARFLLGSHAARPADLAEAVGRLEWLVGRAPEAYRRSMREQNPLYRRILAASPAP